MVASQGMSVTVEELNAMDGFSTAGGIIATFSGPLEQRDSPAPGPGSGGGCAAARSSSYTTASSPLIVIDVDPSSPERGRPVGLVPRWWEQQDDGYYEAEHTLLAQPAVPLRPATRYLFVATDALRARDGGRVHRSALSEELLAGRLEGDYAAELGAALGELEVSLGVSRQHVVLATLFTTASIHDGMLTLAKRVRSAAAPALREPWTVETAPQPDGRMRFRAVFEAPEYRKPPPDGRVSSAPTVRRGCSRSPGSRCSWRSATPPARSRAP